MTTHYIFALGIYRGLYIPNWIWRYFSEGHFDPIAVIAGLIQTGLYADFFYIYFTKCVNPEVADYLLIILVRVLSGEKFELP